MGALLVVLNLPNTPLATFERLPYVGRLAQLMETESGTGRVRVLIWEGVIQMLRPHPALTYPDGATDAFNPVRLAVGYGPESMWVAYPRFYLPELGGLESRNASPDRSHNETFDSLAITGVVGFMAYILLFGGVFYYALKWLGLVRSRWDRIIFIILGLAGGIAGVLIPWLTGYAHLLGVGIPLGFVLGVLVYITYAAFKGAGEALPIDRRQLLIAALLATVVAHFVEIHFGISIAATRTYFFVFVAAMIALGVGALQLADVPEPKPETVPMTRSSKDRRRTSRRSSESVVVAAKSQPFWQRFLPYAVIAALVFLVLDWNFVSNQKQDSNMLVIFVQSWITHLNVNKQLVSGPGAVVGGLVHRVDRILAGSGRDLVAAFSPQRPAHGSGHFCRSYACDMDHLRPVSGEPSGAAIGYVVCDGQGDSYCRACHRLLRVVGPCCGALGCGLVGRLSPLRASLHLSAGGGRGGSSAFGWGVLHHRHSEPAVGTSRCLLQAGAGVRRPAAVADLAGVLR